jgi:hypothetical protein
MRPKSEQYMGLSETSSFVRSPNFLCPSHIRYKNVIL